MKPKISAQDVINLPQIVEEIENRNGLPNNMMTIHAMIETAMGMQI
jgi:citrate lyase beta subunit